MTPVFILDHAAYYRNLRATCKHIDAVCIRELPALSIVTDTHETDFDARVTIEGGICWRDPNASRFTPTSDVPTERK